MFRFENTRSFKILLVALAAALVLTGVFAGLPAAAQSEGPDYSQTPIPEQDQTQTPTQGENLTQAQTATPEEEQDLARIQPLDANPYEQCSLLYAIQPEDTLRSIARRLDTTQSRLLSMNPFLEDLEPDELIPGLVICIEPEADVIPPTGGNPGVTVIAVSRNQSVTVQGINFRANAALDVTMMQFDAQNPAVYRVATLIVPNSGSFQNTFIIPAQLQNVQLIRIRFSDPETGQAATAVFRNFNPVGGGIPPSQCTEFYTVQSGDRLVDIARQFGTSAAFLAEINNIADPNLIIAGQRLCVQGDFPIPPTGSNATLAVTRVTDDVTVQGRNFPAGIVFRAVVGSRDDGGDAVETGQITIPSDGRFTQLFDIPNRFLDDRNLFIRLEQVNGNLRVTANFTNPLADTGGATATVRAPGQPTATTQPPTQTPTEEVTETAEPTVTETPETTM